MRFEYTVKHNGVRYPAGTDVPVGDDVIQEVVEKKPEVVVEKPKAKPQPKKKTVKK